MPLKDSAAALAEHQVGALTTKAVPFRARNASAITSTTPVAIKAAVAGKRHVLTRARIFNPTIAEAAVITIQDDAGTPVVLLGPIPVSTAAGNAGVYEIELKPPVEVAVGRAINGVSGGSLGDTTVELHGYVDDPTPT